MSTGQLAYGIWFSGLAVLFRIVRFFSFSEPIFSGSLNEFLVVSTIGASLNLVVIWYLRSLLLHFEIPKIKGIANIILGVSVIILIFNLLAFSPTFNLFAFYGFTKLSFIFYGVFYIVILLEDGEHLKWVKIYAWPGLLSVLVNFIAMNFNHYLQIPFILLFAIYMVPDLILVYVFYKEYERQNNTASGSDEILDI